jgi:protoporphyrinogen oxidase
MFFRDYTEKVWGRSPNAIPPDWGYQRVKGLSILKVLFNALSNESAQCKEASLTDYFYYPKYGSGYMWETVANDIVNMGGRIIYDDTIEEIETCEDRIERVKSSYGRCFYPDYFISSIPLDELSRFHRRWNTEVL